MNQSLLRMRRAVRKESARFGHVLTSFSPVSIDNASEAQPGVSEDQLHLRSMAICKLCSEPVEVDTKKGIIQDRLYQRCNRGLRLVK